MNDTFDEFSELLGAYALDAVEDHERERIELHLAECPRCRAEVAEHREVAAFLSQSGSDAPDGVWDKIVSELSPAAPPMRLSVAPRSDVGSDAGGAAAPVVPITAGRSGANRSAKAKVLGGLLAAAACIVAVLGFVTVNQSNRLNRLETAIDERSIEGLANDVVAKSAIQANLTGIAGDAEAVVNGAGQGFLITDEFPPPADGSVYQLWGVVDGATISLGTFGADMSVVPFSVDPQRLDDIEAFAVTQELSPGVAQSANEPVIAGTI